MKTKFWKLGKIKICSAKVNSPLDLWDFMKEDGIWSFATPWHQISIWWE